MGDSSSASAESYSKKLAILNQDFTVGHVSLQEYESTKKTLEAELLKAQLQEQQTMPGESFEAKRGSVGSVLSDDSMPLGLQKKLHVAQKQQQQQQPIKVSALSMSTITSTSGFESMIKSPPPLSLTLGMGSEPASVPATNVPVRQRPMSQMMAPPVTTPQLRMGGVGKMAPNSQANPPFNAGNSGSDGSMRQLPFQQKPAVGLPVAGTPMSESYATPVTSTAEAGIMGRMPGMHGSATQSPYHVSDVGGFRPPASSGRPIPPARYSTQFMTVANSPAGMIPVYQTQGPPSQQQIQQQMGQHQRQHPMSPPVMYATPVSHSLPGSFPVPGVDKRASQPVAEVTQQSLAQSIENLKVDAAEPAGEGGNGDYDVQDSNPVNPEVVSSPSHADQPELNRQSMMSVESRSSTMEHQPTTEMLARKSALPTKLEPMGALQVEDETTKQSMRDFPSIASVLQSRATNLAFADARAFSVFDNRLKEVSAISYQDLYFRALKLSQILKVRTANIQDPHVALLFKSFEMSEFIISLFGCFLAGVVAVPISTSSHQPLDEVTEINFMLSHSRVCVVVTSDFSIRILSKAFMSCNIGLPKLDWIKVNEIGLASPKKASDLPSALENGVELAYIEYTKNGSHELKAVLMNHTVIMNQCHLMKSKLNSVKADTIGTYLETRTGIGLLYSVFYNIFIGSHSIFFPYDICMLPGLWPISMSRFNVDVALAEPTGLVSMLSTLQQFPAKEHLNLSGIHTLFVQSQWPSAHFFYDLADALVPLGLKSQDIILPLFGLAEFGGCLFSMAQHAKADSPGLRNVVLERHALSESRVQILRTNQSGTGFKSPDLGDRSVLAALSITESGTLFDQASVAIVDTDSKTLMPKGTIGEIWIHSPALLPKQFWALPTLSNRIFKAHPIMYSQINEPVPKEIALETSERIIYGKAVNESILLDEYVKTGLFGFVMDSESLPGIDKPRIFICGIKRDRIVQKQHTAHPTGEALIRRIFYSNHLGGVMHGLISGLAAFVPVNIPMHNEFLTVVLAETLPGIDPTYASNQIFQQMAAVFGLRLYAVAICQTGSLPRMSVGPQYSTEFTTPYSSYCPGIIEGVILPINSELPQFGYHSRKTGSLVLRSNSLDSEVCRKDFLAGHLFVSYMVMNATPDIISPITLGMTIWDDPAVHSDRRPLQVVQRLGGYNVLDDKSGRDLQGFPDLPHILEWRLSITPELPAFTLLDGRGREQKQVSFRKLSNKAYSLAQFLIKKKGFLSGEYVVVIMTLSLEFIYTIHACLFCGLIPIPFSPPDTNRLKEDLPALAAIIRELKVRAILVNGPVEDAFKSRAIASGLRAACPNVPEIVYTTKAPKQSKTMSASDPLYHNVDFKLLGTRPAVILVSFSADMHMTVSTLTHTDIVRQCNSQIIQNRMLLSVQGDTGPSNGFQPSCRPLIACVRTFSGLGFLYATALGVHMGAMTILLSPFDYFVNPQLWFEAVHKYKVKDAFTTYPMLEHAMNAMNPADYRSFSLNNLDNLMIMAEGRLRPDMHDTLAARFQGSRLEPASISPFFSTNTHPMIASRSYTLCPPTTLWIDTEALKRNIVHVVKEIRGDSVFESEDTSSSDVLALQEFGMACHSVVAVVNPETRTVCAPYEAGEIWVSSSWAGPGGLEGFRLQNDPTGQIFYRTGERAFFWPVPKDMGAPDDACGWTGLVDAGRPYSLSLFVIGPYEREIVVNGLRFCLEDLEQTAESCFEWIAPSGCVIFPHKGSVICVAEIQNEAMFINASSRIALALLRKHRLMVDTIAFMKKGMLAKSRLQEKQRGKVAMAYHMGKLPVIHYVHLSPAKP